MNIIDAWRGHRAKIKDTLTSSYWYKAPVGSEQLSILTDLQTNMCLQFSDIQINSPVRKKMCITVNLAARIMQPLTKNTLMSLSWTSLVSESV